MEIISAERFHIWKQDPVTLAFMENLVKARDIKQKEMLDPNVIRAENSRLTQHEFLGGLDVIEQILSITFEDLELPNDNEENENVRIV